MQKRFLTDEHAQHISEKYGSPSYVYSEKLIREQAQLVNSFPHAYGLTVRYAMKANSNANILRIFQQYGIHLDASSGYEATRAIHAGITPAHIQLSGQQLPDDLSDLVKQGVSFVATSLHQLEMYGKIAPFTTVGVRLNPEIGSGAFKKIDTGGPGSSFGIRHEHIAQINDIAFKYNLIINKIHIHIGSENTAEARGNATQEVVQLLTHFPHVTHLNMGGGFKIAIMSYEKTADLQSIGIAVSETLTNFYEETGRKIHLEIEPGKYLIMNTCTLIARVIDLVDTGNNGYSFIKLNTGMTELPRISMYGIQQPIEILSTNTKKSHAVVGHCCESGDLLTPLLYQSDDIDPRMLPTPDIGDLALIHSCGAYNASMSMKHYNSYPETGEILQRLDGSFEVMRERQQIDEIWKNEKTIELS